MTMFTLGVVWRIMAWKVETITPLNGKLMSRYGVRKLDRGGGIGDWRHRMDANGSPLRRWIILLARGGKRPCGELTWSNRGTCGYYVLVFAMVVVLLSTA